jgi:hypothetical protein
MQPGRNDKLETWKAIASYVGRDIRTVMRWEKDRSFPVHWIPGGGRRAVYAYRNEIDAWFSTARPLADDSDQPAGAKSLPPKGAIAPNSAAGAANQSIDSSFSFFTLTTNHKIASAVAVLAILIIGAAIISRKSSVKAFANPAFPAGIQHTVKITLKNDQPNSAPPLFQQLISVPSSQYRSFEAAHLENIEFFDSTGRVLHSWLESGNSRDATASLYWIQLPDGIPANASADIYLGFAAPDRSVLDAATAGEAPGLSPDYAQFDSGATVFTRYANFRGADLPVGWYKKLTPGGAGGITIDNGAYLFHSGRGGGGAYLGSDWPLDDNIAEMDMLRQETTRGQEMLLVCSSSPTHFKYTADSVGYQDMSGLEIEANDNGTPIVVAAAAPNPPPSAIIGLHSGTVLANYKPVATIPSRVCGGDYLASSVNTGHQASFSFDWIRLRLPPPNDTMPSPSFSPAK